MKWIVVSLFLFPALGFSKNPLFQFCAEVNGKVIQGYQCPKSKLYLPWKFCVSEDHLGNRLFFDGCTGPSGGHKELFYPACIQHDYCYHHEPATNGLSQLECDRRFLDQTLQLCKSAENPVKCGLWARRMYGAVRGFGKLAYHCANYEANYE